ncbi:hypothetical protein [Amycolatopsis azurea]|uniref:hypothetical protein n=1 Tax=Amycolatopsis azurea TaxID=36819 RepID=UPI001AE07D98|nr:hypothetical protein [Amycolatopsis azurea]
MLSPSGGRDPVLSAVTLIVGISVGLTFLFGFGNVLTLALRLGLPVWVVPSAVDLSVVWGVARDSAPAGAGRSC